MSKIFGNIVESVLTEISADDAYNKFYSVIPKDVFDELVGSYGKFDNLLKLVFNYLKSNWNGEDNDALKYAKEFLVGYKNAPNEVRIELNKKIKSGEIEDFFDLKEELMELSENGVETLASIQNSGLVTLYEDDMYLVTITTTYAANHHFYGKSSWCTASDRLGRYDGWFYFLSYILDTDYYEIEDEYDFLLKWSKYGVKAALWQLTYKTSGEIYQLQIFSDGSIGQICNFADESFDEDEINFGAKVKETIKNNAKKAVELTNESFKKEYPYQTKRNAYVQEKRDALSKKIAEMTKELNDRLDEKGERKKDFVSEKFKNLLNTNLLKDPAFLKTLVENTEYIRKTLVTENSKSKYNELEEILKQQNYATGTLSDLAGDDIKLITIIPVFGSVSGFDYDDNGFPIEVKNFSLNNYWAMKNLEMSAIAIVRVDGDEYSILASEKSNGGIKCFSAADSRAGRPYLYDMDSRLHDFICIERTSLDYNGRECYETDILSIKSFEKVTIKGYTYKVLIYGDIMLCCDNSKPDIYYYMIDLNTMKIKGYLHGSAFSNNRHLRYYILKDIDTNDLYVSADKLVYIGKTNLDANDWVGEYYGWKSIWTLHPYSGPFSYIVYSMEKGEIIYRDVNFYSRFEQNACFVEFKNGDVEFIK